MPDSKWPVTGRHRGGHRPADICDVLQGVLSPLVGQMFFRATLFSAFGAAKRWLAKNADGSPKELTIADYYKAGAMTGFAAGFVEGPIDFYKSQVQVQIIRSRADPNYKRECLAHDKAVPGLLTPIVRTLTPCTACSSARHRIVR